MPVRIFADNPRDQFFGLIEALVGQIYIQFLEWVVLSLLLGLDGRLIVISFDRDIGIKLVCPGGVLSGIRIEILCLANIGANFSGCFGVVVTRCGPCRYGGVLAFGIVHFDRGRSRLLRCGRIRVAGLHQEHNDRGKQAENNDRDQAENGQGTAGHSAREVFGNEAFRKSSRRGF